MPRKKRLRYNEDYGNHDRWLISYADFITLLLAFFVVMYATSSVNEGKYRILSHSLVNAFKNNNSSNPISAKSSASTLIHMPQKKQVGLIKLIDDEQNSHVKQQREIQSMARNISHALESLVKDGQVRVTQSVIGITVEINASVLFSPGQAKLEEDSSLALRAVAQIVREHEHSIHVEGHTDNIPIHTENFPSNWELSAARASSVVRLFIENGVRAGRLTAIGYGENRPVEPNEMPEGRKRNRRVAVMILSKDIDRVTEIPITNLGD